MSKIYILSNSPGEVSGWVKPVAEAIRKERVAASVVLVTLPCQYASGKEAEYGCSIEGVEEVIDFRRLLRTASGAGRKNLVLQLGGDPFFGALLSTKLKCGWMIYTSRPKWGVRVSHYFIPDAAAEVRFKKHGISADRYTRVGNLIADSVPECGSMPEMKAKLGIPEREDVISFLPGSRPFEYKDGFAFFGMAAREILLRFRGCNIFMPVAPTVDERLLKEGLDRANVAWRGSGRVEEMLFEGDRRVRLIRGNTFEAIKASKLAVSLPGTNNLQIVSLGVPLLMVAPLNEAENIPLDGLAGMIPLSLPGARRFKKKLVLWYSGREKYVSLPNRLAGKMIVPEHRGIMTPLTVADLVADLLRSPEELRRIVEGYSEIPFERGASAKIALKVAEYFRR